MIETLNSLVIAFDKKGERYIEANNIHIWNFKNSIVKSRLIILFKTKYVCF